MKHKLSTLRNLLESNFGSILADTYLISIDRDQYDEYIKIISRSGIFTATAYRILIAFITEYPYLCLSSTKNEIRLEYEDFNDIRPIK